MWYLPYAFCDKRKWPQVALGEVSAGYQENFLHWENVQALEKAAQWCGGVTDPEVFKSHVDMELWEMV